MLGALIADAPNGGKPLINFTTNSPNSYTFHQWNGEYSDLFCQPISKI